MKPTLRQMLQRTRKRGVYLRTSQIDSGSKRVLRPIPFRLPNPLPNEVRWNEVYVDPRTPHPFFVTFEKHYGFTQTIQETGEDRSKSYRCFSAYLKAIDAAAFQQGKPAPNYQCPICELIAWMEETDSKLFADQIDDMKLQTSMMMNVVDEEQANQVCVFCFETMSIQTRIDEFVTDFGDIADLETGRPIIVRKTGKNKGTRYHIDAGNPGPCPIYQGTARDLVNEALLVERPPLTEMRQFLVDCWPEAKALNWPGV